MAFVTGTVGNRSGAERGSARRCELRGYSVYRFPQRRRRVIRACQDVQIRKEVEVPQSEGEKVANVGAQAETSTNPSEQLIAALKVFWKDGQTGDLRRILRGDCVWEIPYDSHTGVSDILEYLSGIQSWIEVPSLYISPDGLEPTSFSWVMSGTCPYPHRPRVSFAGKSSLEADSDGKIYGIRDDWFAKPRELLFQALPRWEDIWWTYASPHCETLKGLTRVVKKGDDYDIIEESIREEFEVIYDPIDEDQGHMEDYYAVPRAPEEAYTGEVRRLEIYSPTRPTSLQRLPDGKIRWTTPYPTLWWQSAKHENTDPGVTIRTTPTRRLAIKALYNYPDGDEIAAAEAELEEALLRDGLIKEALISESFLFRNYACKHGFDSRGLLTMSVFFGTPLVPRYQEIAVVLDNE